VWLNNSCLLSFFGGACPAASLLFFLTVPLLQRDRSRKVTKESAAIMFKCSAEHRVSPTLWWWGNAILGRGAVCYWAVVILAGACLIFSCCLFCCLSSLPVLFFRSLVACPVLPARGEFTFLFYSKKKSNKRKCCPMFKCSAERRVSLTLWLWGNAILGRREPSAIGLW
jgi:hypothetical protein